jgi:hypothetical protein
MAMCGSQELTETIFNMYALLELHDSGYQNLASLTWDNNKVLYAKKHGYQAFCKTDNFHEGSKMIFQKIWFTKEMMEEHPEVEWFWWTDTDSMITNFSTRIEDRVLSSHHFILPVDKNGTNAGSFLVRNTTEGRAFIDDIISLEKESEEFWDSEQHAINMLLGFPEGAAPNWPDADNLEPVEKYKNVVKLVPQRYMNSFNYEFYREYTDYTDKLGHDGNWQLGDWLIHWPALSNDQRMQLFNFYKEYIIQ